MKAIVITGGLGRIGSKLAPYLRATGHVVSVIGRTTSNSEARGFLVEQGINVHLAECLEDRQSEERPLRGAKDRPIDVPLSIPVIALAHEKPDWSPSIPLARGIALAVMGE